MASLKRYQVDMFLRVRATTYAENREDAEENFAHCGCMIAGNGAFIYEKDYDENDITEK